MALKQPFLLGLGIFLLSAAALLAQRPGPEFRRPLACEPTEPRTKLEAVEWRSERVLVKGFTQVATLNLRGSEARIDAVELKDASDATRVMGIVIALRESGENAKENRSLIDYDEIDPLLRALDAISKVNESTTKLASFEARYRTAGDLEINVFRQARSGTAATVTSGICDRATGYLTLDELDRLRAHLVEAKARLDEIR
ncbi:MAG: hypothetical protein QOJ88_1113 [Pyrinomonadaceae bacterium]|jgi:hypothetical protein|nr:hypothetical protein [Pyrinomonadaceae bacterium]